jgi:hypothetical protein
MIRAGFTIENPMTKSCTVVLESDAETNGMGWLQDVLGVFATRAGLAREGKVDKNGRPKGWATRRFIRNT